MVITCSLLGQDVSLCGMLTMTGSSWEKKGNYPKKCKTILWKINGYLGSPTSLLSFNSFQALGILI